ncbi:type II toxin-antitoxin system prevent-host-death family antitoxin [Thiohalocapsa sp. ML1]|jgi:prevent-host-death family protein|uniref:type II toxin-antitoxin system prevent-host-death family antitoxin n=1 Tax=Thiohalocapsa sp. ML1 TaxID=1431688 RepID=UPI000732240A|nr:type II toxin-antitoxin system prevent-host-death family antitoxin [Thiohalocapsa sp. ML1]
MPWNIADAKQRFSEVVKQAVAEPQLIYNRKRLVAAVIDADDYEAFKAWSEQRSAQSLADEMAELRQLMAEEDYALTPPPRTTRPNAFAAARDD